MKRAKKRFWLINGATRTARRRKVQKVGRKAKRSPPLGFRTWKAYMDSIRPNNKGGTVARRRRRRRNAAAAVNRPRRRRRRRNPATTVALANPRRRRRRSVVRSRRRYANPIANRRRRRRYARNPSMSARGIIGQVKRATKLALQIEAGKLGTRIVRNYIPGVAQYKGKPLGLVVELGAAVASAYLVGMVAGPAVAANWLAGGMLGVIESGIAQYRIPVLYDAISDDGATMTVPAASAPAVAGYVNGLGGYVPPGLGDISSGDYGSGVPELSFAGV